MGNMDHLTMQLQFLDDTTWMKFVLSSFIRNEFDTILYMKLWREYREPMFLKVGNQFGLPILEQLEDSIRYKNN
jgi:hypothetical protein